MATLGQYGTPDRYSYRSGNGEPLVAGRARALHAGELAGGRPEGGGPEWRAQGPGVYPWWTSVRASSPVGVLSLYGIYRVQY